MTTRAHQLLWCFPRAEEAAAEAKAVERCYFVKVQVGAIQAERQVFRAAVGWRYTWPTKGRWRRRRRRQL